MRFLHRKTVPGDSRPTADGRALDAAAEYLRQARVGLFIVAYNAEKTIGRVLERIPARLRPLFAEIYAIDDSSQDGTRDAALEAAARLGLTNFRVYRTPSNQGYGGNQILGYSYAVAQAFDVVVMLHGDAQYAPEFLGEMLSPFERPDVAVALGSRMMRRMDALRGGMPLYKWFGNQLLSKFQNHMLGVRLTEFHTGYRAYRVDWLRRIPFRHNSRDFHFDTEILIQFISAGARIVEVPVPTRYGEEICHVNGLRYAWNCVKAVTKYRLFRMGLFYNRFLDIHADGEEIYPLKRAPNTLHQFVLRQDFRGDRVVELGSAGGDLSAQIAETAAAVVAIDRRQPTARTDRVQSLVFDLTADFDRALGPQPFDVAVALDVIEHLASPEDAVARLARVLRPGGRLYASTANVGFFVVRWMLFLGQFNYGKRGVLDMTHTRLFTVRSFRRLLTDYGFDVERTRGFGPPIRDLISSRFPYSWLDSFLGWMAKIWPGLFAFNFLVIARRRNSTDELLAATLKSSAGVGPQILE
jgi:glycosyltransferase involved in cell wall biosynthesis